MLYSELYSPSPFSIPQSRITKKCGKVESEKNNLDGWWRCSLLRTHFLVKIAVFCRSYILVSIRLYIFSCVHIFARKNVQTRKMHWKFLAFILLCPIVSPQRSGGRQLRKERRKCMMVFTLRFVFYIVHAEGKERNRIVRPYVRARVCHCSRAFFGCSKAQSAMHFALLLVEIWPERFLLDSDQVSSGCIFLVVTDANLKAKKSRLTNENKIIPRRWNQVS